MADLVLDPAKTYAELKRGTNLVARVFAGETIPDWAAQGRRIIEIPAGAAVAVGDRYQPPDRFDAPPAAPSVLERALAAIDAKAEEVRLRYITPGAGQAGTYIEKAKQADEFKAAGYPAGAVPPMVQAEAEATGQTPQAAGDSILQTRDFWVYVKGPAIERERRRGKVNCEAAANDAAVAIARDAALTALEGL